MEAKGPITVSGFIRMDVINELKKIEKIYNICLINYATIISGTVTIESSIEFFELIGAEI